MQRAILALGLVSTVNGLHCGMMPKTFGWLNNQWNADEAWIRNDDLVPTGTLAECIAECKAMTGCRAFSRRGLKNWSTGTVYGDDEVTQCWYKIVPENVVMPTVGGHCGGEKCAEQWYTYVVEGCHDYECNDIISSAKCMKKHNKGFCASKPAKMEKQCPHTCQLCAKHCVNKLSEKKCLKKKQDGKCNKKGAKRKCARTCNCQAI